VKVIEAALGAAPGTARFTVGLGATNRVAIDGDVSTREMSMRTLDEILADHDPVLIKMDVEGYEPEVVTGASAVFRRQCLLAIITETADAKVRSTLANAGFAQTAYQPFTRSLCSECSNRDGEGSQNSLFVRVDLVRERLSTAVPRLVAGIAI
jgi:hypothetical protein